MRHNQAENRLFNDPDFKQKMTALGWAFAIASIHQAEGISKSKAEREVERRGIRLMAGPGEGCLGCPDGVIKFIGAYDPDQGKPSRQSRLLVYGLCDDCLEREKETNFVDAFLEEQMQAMKKLN